MKKGALRRLNRYAPRDAASIESPVPTRLTTGRPAVKAATLAIKSTVFR
jgi:hypothetical protein